MRVMWGLILTALAPAALAAECADNRVDLRGSWGQAAFTVEVARTPDERNRGLMHREEMPRSAGMLFVFERPKPVSFWMRNTLIPLDMVFLDEFGVVQRIHENAIPLDETPIPGGENIQYVLEINGGLASQLGLTPGTELRHPALVGANWRCVGN